MGNSCAFCKDATESKMQEVEEQKRERIKINTQFQDDDLISLKSLSLHSPLVNRDSIVKTVSKRYLTQKYLKVAKVIRKSSQPFKLLYTPLPVLPELSLQPQVLYSYLYMKDRKYIILPGIQIGPDLFYEGQWSLDGFKPEGFGILVEKNKQKYVGNFLNGVKQGLGHLATVNGDVYEGTFCNNELEGSGTVKRKNGLVYTGQFRSGKEHGYGVIDCEGEEIYAGEFENGMKHGQGKLKINEGGSYLGQFFNDLMHGSGTYTWSDGKKYEGDWRHNKIHGEGRYQWVDGSEYFGCYKEGNRDGYGIFKWPDGREYRGEWKMGVMHGSGSYKCQDKNRVFHTIKGVWEMGKKIK